MTNPQFDPADDLECERSSNPQLNCKDASRDPVGLQCASNSPPAFDITSDGTSSDEVDSKEQDDSDHDRAGFSADKVYLWPGAIAMPGHEGCIKGLTDHDIRII